MPEYSYMCEGCGHKWTVFRHMSEYKPKEECPECAEIESVFRDLKRITSTEVIAIHYLRLRLLDTTLTNKARSMGSGNARI